MSLTYPNFCIAFELGKLSVTSLELRNLQDEFNKDKHDILEKNNLLNESLEAQEVLTLESKIS